MLLLLVLLIPIECIKKNTTYKSFKKNQSSVFELQDKNIRHTKLRTSSATAVFVDSPSSASTADFFAADTSPTMDNSSAAASFAGTDI